MSISRFIRAAKKTHPGVIPVKSSSQVKEEALNKIRKGVKEEVKEVKEEIKKEVKKGKKSKK